jgi:8-oxo-dGTP pyrophosphatase MutT (NUDIX family)
MTLFNASEFRERAERHINNGPGDFEQYGDYRLNPGASDEILGLDVKFRDAAVLIPVVDLGAEARIILTKRTDKLRKHSGQIAFPGGALDPEDDSAEVAAIREAEEEIGLARHFVEVVGSLPSIPVLSGFRITPVVSVVRPGFELTPNPDEVDYVFDVPLSFLMNPANHHVDRRDFVGYSRLYYEMPYGEHRIWGITAGIIRSLYERLYE